MHAESKWFFTHKGMSYKKVWSSLGSLSNFQCRMADFSSICCLKMSFLQLAFLKNFEDEILNSKFFLKTLKAFLLIS